MKGSSETYRGPLAVLTKVAENTSLHGIPNAYRARSGIRKAIWSVLFMAGFGLCLYQVASNIKKYKSYPTASTVERPSSKALQFPAVTFCNMNPVRVSRMNQSVLAEMLLSEDSSVAYKRFLDWYFDMSLDDRYLVGHTLDGMLLTCSYSYADCSNRTNFINVSSSSGNCFTFNGGFLPHYQRVPVAGPDGGLQLELFIEESEYLPLFSDVAGIRLLVHNRTYMPMMWNEGVTLAPGFSTNIGIMRLEVRRAKSPYGRCADVSAEELPQKNGYLDLYPYLDYTKQACSVTCYQKKLMRRCCCADLLVPMHGRAFPVLNGTGTKSCRSPDQRKCEDDFITYYMNGTKFCQDECPTMCLEIMYDQKFSFGRWPSKIAEKRIYKALQANFGKEIPVDTNDSTWIQQNVVKVSVYFETLDFETVTTASSYSLINLFSDQGGQVGLWLGLSILTLLEMVELLWDLVVSVISTTNRKVDEGIAENELAISEKPDP